MESLWSFVISLLLGGVAFVIVARLLPNFIIRGGFGSAVLIGLVYGLFKAVLQTVFIILSFPLVLVTLGFFIVIINAFLLWMTDKVMHRLQVRTTGTLILGTILLSVFDFAFQLILRTGAFY